MALGRTLGSGQGARAGAGALCLLGAMTLVLAWVARAPDGWSLLGAKGPAFTFVAVGLSVLEGAAAFVFTRRDRGLESIPVALGGLCSIILAGFGLTRPEVLVTALEVGAGSALLAGAFALARRLDAGTRPPQGRFEGRVELLRPRGRTVSVAVQGIGLGDRVLVPSGALVPADGALATGPVRVDGTSLGLGADLEMGPGEAIFAGMVADATVEVAVEQAPSESLSARLDAQRDAMARELCRPDRWAFGAAVAIGALALAGLGLRIASSPSLRVAEVVLESAVIALAASAAGIPAVIGRRRRLAALERLARGGVVLSRPEDFFALMSADRWQVDPELLVAPGGVEVVAFDELSKSAVLEVAVALVAELGHPDRAALEEAARARRLKIPRGAAFSARGGVVMGTVRGRRWHLGPKSELTRMTGQKISRGLEGTLSFLAERGRRVLLLASPDRGVVGAFGLEVGFSSPVVTLSRALSAEVASATSGAVPDEVRRQVAARGGLPLARGAPGRGTAILLPEDAPLPAAGVAVRLTPMRAGLEIVRGPPRLLEPALTDLARTWSEAKGLFKLRPLVIFAALAPPALVGVASLWLRALSPSAAALAGVSALFLAHRSSGAPLDRASKRSARSRPSSAGEPGGSLDVSLSDIEAVEQAGGPSLPSERGGSGEITEIEIDVTPPRRSSGSPGSPGSPGPGSTRR